MWNYEKFLVTFKYAILLVLVCLAIVSIFRGGQIALTTTDGSLDFQWWGTTKILAKQNPYEIYLSYVSDKQEIENPVFLAQVPNYPAITYLLLSPYGLLDWSTAKAAFFTSNMVFFVLLISALQRLFGISTYSCLLVAALFAISTQFRLIISNGQLALHCIACFLWAIYFSKSGRVVFAGLLLFVSLIKFTLTIPLLGYFVYKRWFAPLFIAFGLAICGTGIVSLWVGVDILDMFILPVRVALIDTEGRGSLDIPFLVSKLSLPSSAAITIQLLVVGFCVYVSFFRRGDDVTLLSLLSLAASCVVFHLSYDLVILIIPLWMLFYKKENMAYGMYILIGFLIFLVWYMDRLVMMVPGDLREKTYWLSVFCFYGSLVMLLKKALLGAKVDHLAVHKL